MKRLQANIVAEFEALLHYILDRGSKEDHD